MCFLSRSYVIKTFMSLLTIGVGFIWVVGASANPPPGILGDVTVQNDASQPVPVTIQGAQAQEPVLLETRRSDDTFDGFLNLSLDDSYTICEGTTPVCQSQSGRFSVPANKQLVIHEVSFKSRVLSGTVPPASSAFLRVALPGGFLFDYTIGLLDLVDPGLNIWEMGVPMHVTAPAGAEVRGRITWSAFGATNVEGSMTISGELVSAP